MVVIVLNKESAIWKDASMKTLSRGDAQLTYIDIERMRVVTSHRCVVEQIKSDSGERPDGWVNSWKSWRRAKFEKHRVGWSLNMKSWGIGEFQN